MGWYYSNDTQIIKEQFAFMHYAGINFVLISWWNDSETDNSTWWVFQTMNNSLRSFGIKLAISIEPVNESGTYDFQALRDYIYNRYVLRFQDIYMELDGKPLLTWM
jgi:hypothetical protein